MLLEDCLLITLLDVLRMIPVSWVDVIRKVLLRLMFVYQSLPFSKSVKGKQDIVLLIFALLYNRLFLRARFHQIELLAAVEFIQTATYILSLI